MKNKINYEVLLTYLCEIGLMVFAIQNIASLSIPYIIDDEFGYWGVGAWLNGYDWSGVMQYCNYYSYGYGFLLAILIKLAGSMGAAYKSAILLNGVFLVGIFTIVAKLSKEMFPTAPYIVRLGIALILTLSPNNVYHVNIAWPELLLSFIVWVALYMLLCFFHSGKMAWLYGLSAVLVYGYMVHNRLLVLMISLMVVLVFSCMEKKIKIKNILIIFVILFAGFFVSQQIKAFFYANLWLNSKVAAAVSFSRIFRNIIGSFSNFAKLLEGFIGKITYFLIATMNMLLIYIILCLKVIKQKTRDGYDLVALFILTAFMFEIALTSFQMTGADTNSINILLYGRYADIFVGSTILFTIYFISKEPIHKYIIISFLISAAVCLLFAFLSAKAIANNGLTVFGSMNNIYLYLFWDGSKLHLLLASFISCLVGALKYICVKKPVGTKSFKILFAGLLLVNCIWSYSSMNAVGKTVLAFQEQQSYMQDCAAMLSKYDEKSVMYFLNGNNVYDNRIKNIMQFLCPEKRIIGQKRLDKIVNSENIVICSAQNAQILELMFMGYGIIYENNDVIITERDSATKGATLGNSCWLLGGNGENKNGHLISSGQNGMFIESRPYLLQRGNYLLETLISIKGDSCTEAGFLYLTNDGIEIARTNIYCKDNQTIIPLPFYLEEQSDDFQIHIYLYDGITAEFESASITPIGGQKETLTCRYNDPMFLGYCLSGYEIAYAGEDIVILTRNDFSNSTAFMQPANLILGGAGDDSTTDIIKSNGAQGLFFETKSYYLEKGTYSVRLSAYSERDASSLAECGFIFITENGSETARANIYIDKNNNILTECTFHLDVNSENVIVHIYLYDEVFIQLEELSIAKYDFSNTVVMQPDNLILGGAGDDSTDDIIKSNGTQGLFFETKPYYLEKGTYTVRLSAYSEKDASSLVESGFIYITENGSETARTNIYIDEDNNILTECTFHLDVNSENVIVHIYLYDEIFIQLEELSITKSQQDM